MRRMKFRVEDATAQCITPTWFEEVMVKKQVLSTRVLLKSKMPLDKTGCHLVSRPADWPHSHTKSGEATSKMG